jgi:NodT family efflux transporter outer membrane factor (OMF) lipoprotein
MKLLRLMVFATSGLSAAACVLPPKDAPRAAAVPDAALGLGSAPAPQIPERWWQAFGDAQLDRLVERTLAQNPQLAEALARVRAAQAQTDAARAGRLPAFALDATETRQRFSARDIVPPPYGGHWYWRGDVLADFSWDLDLWGEQAARIAQARDQQQAAALDVAAAKLALAGALAQAYVDLDRNAKLAEIAARAEEQRAEILQITRQRLAAGLDTRVELREAEGALPRARLAREQAQAAQELAKHQLAALSGQGANAYAAIRTPQRALDTALPLPQILPADLLARRPDVIAARLRLAAADAQRKADRAAFYPSMDLSGFAGWGSIGLDQLFKAPSAMYGLGPSVHLPIFDAGRLKAQYRGAVAGIDAAVAEYNGTVLRAVQQVADQLTRVQSLARQLAEQQQALAAAEDAYRLAKARYAAGLTNYLGVLNAETQVLAARRERVQLLADQAVARVSLLLTLGGSFHPQNADPATLAATP